MLSIRKRVSELLRSPDLPLYIFWFAFAVAHIFFSTTHSDDAWFLQILEGDKLSFQAWYEYLVMRYHTWTSRIPIEGLLVLMVRFPLIWKICDTLIIIAISVLINRLFNPERDRIKAAVFVLSALLFPMPVIYEVGFVATSVNYSWPFAAALLALTPAAKEFQGREVAKREYIFAIPALVFACFSELLAAVLLIVFAGSCLYRLLAEKKAPIYQIVSMVICVLLIVYALSCPGNDNRVAVETAARLPEFAGLSFFQKAELGFSSMMKTLVIDLNIFVLVFCFVLLLSVWHQTKKLLGRILSAIPLLFTLLFGALGAPLAKVIPFIADVRDWVGPLGTGFRLTAPDTWLADVVFVLLLATIVISLRYAVKDTKTYCFFVFLLAVGAISRIGLGLSPTVWESKQRIAMYLYVSMSVVLGWMLHRCILFLEGKGKIRR